MKPAPVKTHHNVFRDTQITILDTRGKRTIYRGVKLPPDRAVFIGQENGRQAAERLGLEQFYDCADRLVICFPSGRFVTSSFLIGLMGAAVEAKGAALFNGDAPAVMIAQGDTLTGAERLDLADLVLGRLQREVETTRHLHRQGGLKMSME